MPIEELKSVRFSTRESPNRINSGRGWTEIAARRWLRSQRRIAAIPTLTENQLRFAQTHDTDLEEQEWTTQTEDLPKGVQFVGTE